MIIIIIYITECSRLQRPSLLPKVLLYTSSAPLILPDVPLLLQFFCVDSLVPHLAAPAVTDTAVTAAATSEAAALLLTNFPLLT
jgi:hypothetical protein